MKFLFTTSLYPECGELATLSRLQQYPAVYFLAFPATTDEFMMLPGRITNFH